MHAIKMLVAAVAVAGLAGCETMQERPKETVGAVGGALAGAWAGSHVKGTKRGRVATVAGAILGGLIGRGIGRSLDRADQAHARQTTSSALEGNRIGQTASWRNPDSGNHGTVTPTRTYTARSGTPCREYQTTVTVDGRTVQGHGTACREADGSWRIVN